MTHLATCFMWMMLSVSSGYALGNRFPVDDAECTVYGDALGNLFHVDDA